MTTHFYRNIYLKFCNHLGGREVWGNMVHSFLSSFFLLVLFVLFSTLSSLFVFICLFLVGGLPTEKLLLEHKRKKKKEPESMPIVGILDENNLKHKLIQFSSSIQKNEEQREIK